MNTDKNINDIVEDVKKTKDPEKAMKLIGLADETKSTSTEIEAYLYDVDICVSVKFDDEEDEIPSVVSIDPIK